MATNDTCVSLCPYFEVQDGKLDAFKANFDTFIGLASNEEKCMFYAWSVNGNIVHCREGYADAEGLLDHLQNVDAPLKEALAMAKLARLEVHGPESELAKLREPLAGLNPDFFVLERGFRN
jgi:quinol monooxygenase YgiN